MAGETATPEMSYHKETKLLIAFGEPAKLNPIQSVLQSLPYSSIGKNNFEAMQNQIGQLQKEVDILEKRRTEADLLLKKISQPATQPGTLEIK